MLAELGDQDYTAADFFEAYAAAIEREADRRRYFEVQVDPSIRRLLLDALVYFEDPSENIQAWPAEALRAMAMLAPLQVGSELLGIGPATLDRAVGIRLPNKDWAWWHALGRAILAGRSAAEIADVFELTPYGVRKYTKFLLGSLRAQERSAA